MKHPAGIYSVDCKDWRNSWATVVDNWHGHAFNSPNDVVEHSDGSLWFTDPCYGHKQGFRSAPEVGNWVWVHHPRHGVTHVVADGFSRPNGLCFSPDGQTLYVTDTGYATGDAIDATAPRTGEACM